MGATHIIDTTKLQDDTSLVDAIRQALKNSGPSIVVETTGDPYLIKASMKFVRNRGKIVQVGSAPYEFRLQLDLFDFMVRGLQYIGAVEGNSYPSDLVPKLAQWYKDGKLPVDKMTKLLPIDQFETALREMQDGQTIKPVLCWS
jgi:Zn-dependent alcohol dehydrogenase